VTVTSAFNALLEQQRSDEQREALHRLRDELGLRNDDALWQFIAVIEQHFAACRAPGAAPPPARPALVPYWVWACLGMGAQAVFGGLCVLVGMRAAQGVPACWTPVAIAGRSWLQCALSVPAGWMAFFFALPAAGFAAQLGWRLRRAGEVGWGYSVLFTAASAAAASALALWRLV
jgi:hypothetical protein